ncbi:MAG: hypothetical protein ACRYFS_03690 [Janthinobacterium lividum]
MLKRLPFFALVLSLLMLPSIASATAIALSASTLPAGHSTVMTVTVAGTGTAFSGSPFTVTNSVTGTTTVSIASQTVSTATAATLTLKTGQGTGTATVSDGAGDTATITVAQEVLTITLANGATSIPLYGSSAATISSNVGFWTVDHPAFAVPTAGGLAPINGAADLPAALIASAVAWPTNTTATCTLTAGNVSGVIQLADPSVALAPAGAGPVVVAYAGSLAGDVLQAANPATSTPVTPGSLTWKTKTYLPRYFALDAGIGTLAYDPSVTADYTLTGPAPTISGSTGAFTETSGTTSALQGAYSWQGTSDHTSVYINPAASAGTLIRTGIYRAAGNYDYAEYNATTGLITLAARNIATSAVTTLATITDLRTTPFTLHFVANHEYWSVWRDSPSATAPYQLELSASGAFAGAENYYYYTTSVLYHERTEIAYSAAPGTASISGISAGYFGGLGVSDCQMVTYEDGTPFTRNGLYYFTSDTPGAVSSLVTTTSLNEWDHDAIFSYDPITQAIVQVGQIPFNDSASTTYTDDGANPSIMYDRTTSSWIYSGGFAYVSGVNYFGYSTFASDPTLGGVVRLSQPTAYLPVNGTTAGITRTYDSCIAHDPVSRLWYIGGVSNNSGAFANQQLYLYSCPTRTGTYSLVGNTSVGTIWWEGARFVQVNKTLQLWAGYADMSGSPTGAAATYDPIGCFDLTFTRQGDLTLNTAVLGSGATHIMHPCTFRLPTPDGHYRYRMIGWNSPNLLINSLTLTSSYGQMWTADSNQLFNPVPDAATVGTKRKTQ